MMASRISPRTQVFPLGKKLARRKTPPLSPTAPGQRQPRVKSGSYLVLIRRLPCLRSGIPELSEAAHVRYGDPSHKKRPTGMGEKPDDKWTLPLSPYWHRLSNDAQHNHNERLWWEQIGIDPLEVCQELWRVRDNFEAMEEIVEIFRPREHPTIASEVLPK